MKIKRCELCNRLFDAQDRTSGNGSGLLRSVSAATGVANPKDWCLKCERRAGDLHSQIADAGKAATQFIEKHRATAEAGLAELLKKGAPYG